jgi:hypothetical protein
MMIRSPERASLPLAPDLQEEAWTAEPRSIFCYVSSWIRIRCCYFFLGYDEIQSTKGIPTPIS